MHSVHEAQTCFNYPFFQMSTRPSVREAFHRELSAATHNALDDRADAAGQACAGKPDTGRHCHGYTEKFLRLHRNQAALSVNCAYELGRRWTARLRAQVTCGTALVQC